MVDHGAKGLYLPGDPAYGGGWIAGPTPVPIDWGNKGRYFSSGGPKFPPGSLVGDAFLSFNVSAPSPPILPVYQIDERADGGALFVFTAEGQGLFTIDHTLVVGPVPGGGLGPGNSIPPLKKIRTRASYTPESSTIKELPEFESLEILIELIHLRKQDNQDRFVNWTEAVREFVEESLITKEINLHFPYKTWPKLDRSAVYDRLLREYPEEVARPLAMVIQQWTEQHMLDEEDNWRTIEIWSEGLTPKYEY